VQDPTAMFSPEDPDTILMKLQECLEFQKFKVDLHATKYRVN
jgi:hypothetical protein